MSQFDDRSGVSSGSSSGSSSGPLDQLREVYSTLVGIHYTAALKVEQDAEYAWAQIRDAVHAGSTDLSEIPHFETVEAVQVVCLCLYTEYQKSYQKK